MSSSSDSNQKLYSIDLKNCIEQYAWKKFRENTGCFRSLLVSKNKHYHETTSGVPEIQAVDLYKSDHEKKTSLTQQYTFSATRETRSSATVEVQDNYTLEGSMNLEIDLGGFGKLGGGFSQSLSATKTSCETFEKALGWAVNTEVRVKPWHKAIASLRVYELNKVYDLEVKTTVSLPRGHLPVATRSKKDDTIVWVFGITKLPVIFDEKFRRKSNIVIVEEHLRDVDRIRENIELTTHGVCKIVSWTEQHVKVESEETENIPEHIKKCIEE
ncbi:hypothetical protein ACJMK2_017844 [Sinanodonta woodiana]|uniref:Uncharacterized protein n=1 Tax=Sinanodonta woodiana TaxID=1069815 RepID=A0ABD3UF63_SINWO